jgi:hypothetical protein
MCCGRNRTMIQMRTPASASRTERPPAAFVGRQRSNVAYFEYTGKTALIVVGSISRNRYRFAAPGSRLAVDLRDRKHLAAVPHLVPVLSL